MGITDNNLMELYTNRVEDIAGRYESGGLAWLKKNNSALYAVIEAAEDKLNQIWKQCLEGKAEMSDYTAVLSSWHEKQIEGIEEYKQRGGKSQ